MESGFSDRFCEAVRRTCFVAYKENLDWRNASDENGFVFEAIQEKRGLGHLARSEPSR
jgi:hypothetical protein